MSATEDSLAHTRWECKYHIVFIPKYRKKSIFAKLRPALGEVLRELAIQKEGDILEGHLPADHVHMLISIPPLWKAMRQGNALLDRLKPLLRKSCLWNAVTSSTPNIWSKSVLAGPESLLIGAVNRQVHVSPQDPLKFVYTQPSSAVLAVNAPKWLRHPKLYKVAWDGVEPVDLKKKNGTIMIPVLKLEDAAVYVLSSDPEIETKLAGTPALAGILETLQETPKAYTDIVAPFDGRDVTPLTFNGEDIVVDFSKPEALDHVSRLQLVNATLARDANGRLCLLPDKEQAEARAELTLPLRAEGEFQADLRGVTAPGYYANMELILLNEKNIGIKSASTIKADWFTGEDDGEFISCSFGKDAKEPCRAVRIIIKDPMIVSSDEATVILKRLVIRKGN